MTKKKEKARPEPKVKSRGKPRGGGFLRSLARPWVWWLSLIILLTILLIWQWSTLTGWVASLLIGSWEVFGWGLILILLGVIIVIGVILREYLSDVARRWKLNLWNKWLGGIAFFAAIWGTLALFDVGGRIGLSIIGAQNVEGALRVLALVILGIILVAPGACWRSLTALISLLTRPSKREPPPPRPVQTEFHPPHHPQIEPRRPPAQPLKPPERLVPPEIIPKTGIPTEAINAAPTSTKEAPIEESAKPAPTPAEPDLKQVAQDVWKKYGESPTPIIVDGWQLPPIEILDIAPEIEFSQADNEQRAALIEEALASYGVEAKVIQINAGPTVTQFGVEPGWDRKIKEIKERDKDGNIQVRYEELSKTRVKVERIASLANNLALALAAPTIRIEAPVPGKAIVGIEVPNRTSSVVSLRSVIETNAFQKTLSKSKMGLVLGKGAGGEAIAGDLTRMPHLLIAGATGSGKTVCLNSIICCLLMHNTPADIRFIMIDPKRVELTPFNSIPHLATPVIVDTTKALTTLRWLDEEMDKRYQILAKVNARNIEAYNRNREGTERMPYLVLVIDELADLMMAGFDEVEHILCHLAQMARAIGIHLIVATQRPSVDVVTGLIKANFPTRISFAVTSQVDSRTILDIGGAEKLLGKGDMLYAPTEAAKPKRLQGCYVSDAETERLVFFWSNQRKTEATTLSVDNLTPTAVTRGGFAKDPLLETARQMAREHSNISTSFLQRRLHIGYPRAARIMDQLMEEGIEEEEEGEGEV